MTTTDVDLSLYYVDSVVSGLTVTQDTLLDGIVAGGVAYIDQAEATIAGDTNSFTASKDTYIDVTAAGAYTYIEETIDAAEPALTADSIRIAMVQTDGTEITTITDMRTMHNGTYAFVELTLVGTAMELYNGGKNPVYVRHGAASTSVGMPIAPLTSKSFDETVYVKPTGSNGLLLVTG